MKNNFVKIIILMIVYLIIFYILDTNYETLDNYFTNVINLSSANYFIYANGFIIGWMGCVIYNYKKICKDN